MRGQVNDNIVLAQSTQYNVYDRLDLVCTDRTLSITWRGWRKFFPEISRNTYEKDKLGSYTSDVDGALDLGCVMVFLTVWIILRDVFGLIALFGVDMAEHRLYSSANTWNISASFFKKTA